MKAKKTVKKKSLKAASKKRTSPSAVAKKGLSSPEDRGYTIIAKPSKPSFSKSVINKMMALSKEN